MAKNYFVMPQDLIRGQIGSYEYMQTRNLKKRSKKDICRKQ